MSCDDADLIRDCMKRSAAVLRDIEVPFALGGSMAVWARGGPPVTHDVDFIVRPDDVDKALSAFQAAGFRIERPPEEWLVKAYDESGCLVDLIHQGPLGAVAKYLDNAEDIVIDAIQLPAMSIDDVLVMKLGAMTERYMDFVWALQTARSVREQINWDYVSRELADSPFAAAFFVLCERLDIKSSKGA